MDTLCLRRGITPQCNVFNLKVTAACIWEVDEHTLWNPHETHVHARLNSVFILERLDRLQLYYNFRIDDKVCTNVSNCMFIKHDWNDSLRLIGNTRLSQSHLHGVVVHALRKPRSEGLPNSDRNSPYTVLHTSETTGGGFRLKIGILDCWTFSEIERL